MLKTTVTTSETFDVDPKVAAEAQRTQVMGSARSVFDTVTAQIADWRKINSLGGAFYGAVLDLERTAARLGTYIDNPGIGTNVVQREIDLVNKAFLDTREFFERQNGAKISAIDAAILAAQITKTGASITLSVLDRSRFIKAGYEGAIKAIEAHQSGASPGTALFRGATQAVLEKVRIINDKDGISVVTKSINEAYKVMGTSIGDLIVFMERQPKPTQAELREFAARKVTTAAFVVALAPMKGIISDLDKRTSDVDLPSLAHGASVTLVELFSTAIKAIINSDDKKKENK